MATKPGVMVRVIAATLLMGCGARTGLGPGGVRDGGTGPSAPDVRALDLGVDVPLDRSGGDLPGPPQLLSPVSTGRVTTRHPELRWALAPESTGARLQLCRDRACREVSLDREVTGAVFRPTQALAPGVWFWRAWGRREASAGDAPSATWQFTVGARDAVVSTSWGTVPDFNGDGYADVAVGATGREGPGSAGVSIYPGGPMGVSATPARTIAAPRALGAYFAWSIGSAGDVDGDGFADLVVGALSPTGARGAAFVYRGGPDGVGATPPVRLDPPAGAGAGFGVSVSAAGDVDGDGYGDVIVGAPLDTAMAAGSAYLYRGSAAGLRVDAPLRLRTRNDAGPGFGRAVVGACDFNGDGYADLAISESGVEASGPFGRGIVSVYLGRAAGPSAPDSTLIAPTGEEGGDFARVLACAGDFNGDGRTDLLVGDPRSERATSRAHVFLSGPRGELSRPRVTLLIPDGEGRSADLAVATTGDLDGDGFDDVVVGDGTAISRPRGRVLFYRGHDRGPGEAAPVTVDAPMEAPATFGRSLAIGGGGDVDGDGFDDLIVGAPETGGGASVSGRVFVFRGGRVGVGPTPMQTLRGPDESGNGYGASVASRLGAREASRRL